MRLTNSNIIELAKYKGWSYEEQPSEDIISEGAIGITFGAGVWHWFKICGLDGEFKNTVSYWHSYSCNNGRTMRGVRKGVRLVIRLESEYKKMTEKTQKS